MSKQCFSSDVMDRYGRTIERVKTQYKNIEDQQRANYDSIMALVRNLSRLTTAQDHSESLRRGRKSLNAKTTQQYLTEVLSRAQRPLTADEIYVRMTELGWMTTARNRSGVVSVNLRANPTLFTRVARGLYSLNREA